MPARRSLARTLQPLRLAFRRPQSQGAAEPELGSSPSAEVEFVAYAEDCILSGHVGLADPRVSDLLNAHERYELLDVLVTPLSGELAIEVRDVAVDRDEIHIVHAAGPRGDAARRQRTRQHPIVVKSGPYEVSGYIHATPGSDPIASFRRRKPMVALTDAKIRFTIGGRPHEQRAATVIINRELVDWVVEGLEEDVPTLDVPIGEAGPLTKDFTGDLLTT